MLLDISLQRLAEYLMSENGTLTCQTRGRRTGMRGHQRQGWRAVERKRGVQKSRGSQKDEEGGNKREMERAREREGWRLEETVCEDCWECAEEWAERKSLHAWLHCPRGEPCCLNEPQSCALHTRSSWTPLQSLHLTNAKIFSTQLFGPGDHVNLTSTSNHKVIPNDLYCAAHLNESVDIVLTVNTPYVNALLSCMWRHRQYPTYE